MENQGYNRSLTEYLRQALKLESQDDQLLLSSHNSPSYYPSRLLDLKWDGGKENVSNLNIIKKVFGDPPPTSQPCNDSILNSEYGFLAAPPLNTHFITECVTVPTSKHVAQILGKKGSKIRELRDATKTYIRSPLPNEEPVFVIKGKKAGVDEAVKAIKVAAQFFSTLDKDKEKSYNSDFVSYRGESIVVKFFIPESFVGLVVGIKGSTIKEIEKATNTYIKSPNFGSSSIFTITGAPDNCEKAMHFISRYLEYRGVGPGLVIENFSDLERSAGYISPENSCLYSFSWVHINPTN